MSLNHCAHFREKLIHLGILNFGAKSDSLSVSLSLWCSLTNDDFLEVLELILLVVVGELIEDFLAGLGLEVAVVVEALAANSSGEVKILLQDCHAVGVDGAEVGVFEEAGQVALSGILEGQKG